MDKKIIIVLESWIGRVLHIVFIQKGIFVGSRFYSGYSTSEASFNITRGQEYYSVLTGAPG